MRSIGLVYFGQAVVAIVLAALLLSPVIQGAHTAPLPLLSSSIYLIFLAALQSVAGYGLITLATWSRLCALLQTFYLLAGFAFGLFALAIDTHAGFIFAILHALPFYILFGPRAGYVLSPGYGAIVAAAPGRVGGSALLAVLIAIVFVTSDCGGRSRPGRPVAAPDRARIMSPPDDIAVLAVIRGPARLPRSAGRGPAGRRGSPRNGAGPSFSRPRPIRCRPRCG